MTESPLPARALRIEVLGPLRGSRQGAELNLGPVRRQAVLAHLLAHRGQLVTQEQLLEAVWGGDRPATGRQVLPSYVYALRRSLDVEGTSAAASVIQGAQGAYRFVADAVGTDLDELAALLRQVEQARESNDPVAVLERCANALPLFRGVPLAGLPGPFAEAERARLTQRRRALDQARLDSLILLGRPNEALDETAGLATAAPFDEALAALRMRALYGAGRPVDALDAFRDFRTRLLDAQGVEPGEPLRQIQQAILRRDDAVLLGHVPTRSPSAVAPTAVLTPRARARLNELPGDTTHFIGREAELAQLGASAPADAVSVVTVAGIAGVGKTALTVRAAWQLLDSFPDGALFVDLRAHSASHEAADPRRVLHRLLRTLTGTEHTDADSLDELVAAWRAATGALRLLLVVDDAIGAEQVRPLLPAGPGSQVMVTSRKHLTGLDADRRVNLEPLHLDEAVGLFGRLLGAERTKREPEAVRSLASRCDGLPLALRIAGARLQHRPTWTVAHMVERLQDDDRRLAELRAEDRSVEGAFRFSYDQLQVAQQGLFRVLGQAPSAEFDARIPAAMLGCPRQVADDMLESLVEASLVQQPRPGRYRLHDLVRTHSRRLCAESSDDARALRASAFRLYAEAGRMASDVGHAGFPTGSDVTSSTFASWLEAAEWLDAAGGDLVDVVSHAGACQEADLAGWIAEALLDHLVRQGRYHECRTALQAALACVHQADDQRLPAALHNAMGFTDLYQGRFQPAHSWFSEARRLALRSGDRREEARALGGLGGAERALGLRAMARTRLRTVMDMGQELQDDWLSGMSACNLGAIHHHEGRPQEALDCFSASLAYAEKIGRPRMISKTLCHAAEVLLELGDFQQAAGMLTRAAELARQVRDAPLLAVSLTRLGTARHAQGDIAGARDLHHQALTRLNEQSSAALEIEIRTRMGATCAAAGNRFEAHQHYRDALAIPGVEDFPRERDAALAGLRTTAPEPGMT